MMPFGDKPNPADDILDRMTARVNAVGEHLAARYKGVKPFDKPVLKRDDIVFNFDQLTLADLETLAAKYGQQALSGLAMQVDQWKRDLAKRRGGNNNA